MEMPDCKNLCDLLRSEITELEQKLDKAMECVELYCDDDNECYGDYHPPNFARKTREEIEQI